MLFTSISFLYYFLPALIIIYFITPKKYKNIILLIASLLFYFYGEPKYVFLMIAEIIIAYIGAILIDKYKNQSKNILITTLFIHIFCSCFFRIHSITNLQSKFNWNISNNWLRINHIIRMIWCLFLSKR